MRAAFPKHGSPLSRVARLPRRATRRARRADHGLAWLVLALALALPPCLSAPASAAAAAPSQAWLGSLKRAVAARGFEGAMLSVLVVDRASGAELFAHRADAPLMPASTQKLLTALAALRTFGPAYRFPTELRVTRDASGRVKDLVVVAGGDPTLTSEQWWRLAADLRAQGLDEVRGDLVLDDSAFDSQRWHPSWQPVTSRAYYAPVGALSANYGAFRVVVAPGRAVGDPLVVRVDPPVPWLKVRSHGVTKARRAKTELRVDRRPGTGADLVVVGGGMRLAAEPHTAWRSVSDPTAYAGAVLRMQLEAVGIPVRGSIRSGPAPQDSEPFLTFEGEPLHRVVTLFLKYSNNFIAECLVKALGRQASGDTLPGSWKGGVAAVTEQLREAGLSLEGVHLVDGSGLSHQDRVPARLLVGALRAADRDFGVGPELLAALPIAGEDGTLKKRAASAHGVRAKTGSLDGVTALAGFARTHAGRDLIFALIANGVHDDAQAVAAADGFAAALVRDGAPGGGPGATSP